MPSVTLHLVLADRVLERWQDDPSQAPFDSQDPVFVNAFHQGSFGPDLGYFPGGHRFLSDLSHLVRSGDLARALVRSARTPLERAFAWGWVTHVLADRAVHPLVGKGVGEHLFGTPDVFVDGSANQAAHVQVETGLDAFYSRLFPGIRRRKMAPVFDGSSIRFLVNAYRRTYGLEFDPQLLLSSHLATVRMSVQALVSIGVMSTALLARPVAPPWVGARWFLRHALSLVRDGLGRESLLLAYLNPVPPTPWLVEAVGDEVERFADTFFRHYQEGLAGLENANLDTGDAEVAHATHRGTLKVRALLDRLGTVPLPAGAQGRGFPRYRSALALEAHG